MLSVYEFVGEYCVVCDTFRIKSWGYFNTIIWSAIVIFLYLAFERTCLRFLIRKVFKKTELIKNFPWMCSRHLRVGREGSTIFSLCLLKGWDVSISEKRCCWIKLCLVRIQRATPTTEQKIKTGYQTDVSHIRFWLMKEGLRGLRKQTLQDGDSIKKCVSQLNSHSRSLVPFLTLLRGR